MLRTYQLHLRKRRGADSGRGKRAKVLGCMMEDVRVTTRGMKHTRKRATTTAFLRPKTAEKCRLLLNPEEVHAGRHQEATAIQAPALGGTQVLDGPEAGTPAG